MDRLRPREAAATIAFLIPTALALLGCDSRPMTQDEVSTRERILTSYRFTPQAQTYLRQPPLYLHNDWANGGGYAHEEWDGYTWGECGQDTRDITHKDEACLHEMSHLWNYHQQAQNPQTNSRITQAFRNMAANQPVGNYWYNLVFGNGGDFRGLDGNATEEYASGASAVMGDLTKVPRDLIDIYKDEFISP